MNGYSTLTQKGQVAIPKSIRDQLKLNPFDKLYFSVENNKITAEPVPQIEDMFGIISSKRVLSKKTHKKIVRDAVLAKFNKKLASK